jgi:hypothetical protein
MAAIGTSTGYYVSLDGETAIGLVDRKDGVRPDLVDILPDLVDIGLVDASKDGLPEYGEDIDCVFMGVFTMFKNKAPKFVK